ncbi:MAG: hypothetical protein INR69_16200 [Mucilaginibacter polytrichastri]|nr:hypothetical protein [Mucilaginibacter polytrichastri]
MKTYQGKPSSKNQMQGSPVADRSFLSAKDERKKHGITNAGGQRSDQTSNEKTIQREKREG